MEVVLLCGGTGTRLREQTEFIPKPLIPIGGKPLVVRIMEHYIKYSHSGFVLALGYKQEQFKLYFNNYQVINQDMILHRGHVGVIESPQSDFTVILSDTGENTLKGGRLKRIEQYISGDTFMMTYGDALSDVNLDDLVNFHTHHGKMVTITGVRPRPRFGEILHENGEVIDFKEKPASNSLVNGGFMVLNRKVFDYLDRDCDFEKGPLEQIAKEGELMVYQHTGYWRCMDTYFDMLELQKEWRERNA